MKKRIKLLSIIMILSMTPLLISCGNDKNSSDNDTAVTKAAKDVNIETVADTYLNAYLGKEADFEKSGLDENEIKSYITRRDFYVVNLYSNGNEKDGEILKAYYEALKKVEVNIKSVEEKKVVVGVKGIDISNIKKEVQTHMMKVKREREVTIEELRAEGENKVIELIKNAPVQEEKEIQLAFIKDSEENLKLSSISAIELENTLSFIKDDYNRYEGEIPQDFKDIEAE